jgi:hypothetical protein
LVIGSGLVEIWLVKVDAKNEQKLSFLGGIGLVSGCMAEISHSVGFDPKFGYLGKLWSSLVTSMHVCLMKNFLQDLTVGFLWVKSNHVD